MFCNQQQLRQKLLRVDEYKLMDQLSAILSVISFIGIGLQIIVLALAVFSIILVPMYVVFAPMLTVIAIWTVSILCYYILVAIKR